MSSKENRWRQKQGSDRRYERGIKAALFKERLYPISNWNQHRTKSERYLKYEKGIHHQAEIKEAEGVPNQGRKN